MTEKTMACKALAAMFKNHGDPNDLEITFVANAAMELGLDNKEADEVMQVLKEGGDYQAFIGGMNSKAVKTFFFRRVVAATLLDEQIEDAELKLIYDTAGMLAFNKDAVDEYLEWMKEGIAWDKRGIAIAGKL